MENENAIKKAWPLVLTLVLTIVFLIAIVSYGTYAYFFAAVGGTSDKKVSTINTAEISATLAEGTLTGGNLIPGESVSKTFKVKNTGKSTLTYNVFLRDIVNNFVNKADLVVTLKEDGTTILSNYQFPNTSTTDIAIKTGLTIIKDQEKTYELIITYKNSASDQTADSGKTFSTKVGIN